MKMIKLHTPITDKFTKARGLGLFWRVEMGPHCELGFRPLGTTSKGKFLEATWLHPDRVDHAEWVDVPIELPLHAFGQLAQHMPTGFEGYIFGFVVHPTGCVHIELQPEGTNSEGNIKPAYNFDIREVVGLGFDLLAPHTKETMKQPSPVDTPVASGRSENYNDLSGYGD